MNHLRFLPLFLTVIGLSGIGKQQSALAQTSFTVTTTADAGAGSLRQAFADVTSSTVAGPFTITFGVSGTINVASTLTTPTKSVVVSGSSTDPDDVVLDGGGNTTYSLLSIPASSTVTMAYLTLANGGATRVSGNLTLNRCVLRGNRSLVGSDNGGAIAVISGNLRISNSYLYNNRTTNNAQTGLGGAIYSQGTGSFTITTSTFTSNTAAANGGAIQKAANTGIGIVENCTFSNNVGISGGAIEAATGSLTITSSTFTQNRATTSGGGIFGGNGSNRVTINNCLIAGNTATTNGPDLISGFRSDVGHNLIGSLVGSPTLDASTTGNITGVSASTILSATLADNSGPTPTHALLNTGPAYNAGPPSFTATTDQRGLAVFGGRRDIGAFEAQTYPPLVATVSSVSNAVCSTGVGRFILGATGGNGVYQYKLTSAGSFSSLTTNPLTVTGVAPSNYTVTVQDGLGNADDVVVTIAPASLTLTTVASLTSPCVNTVVSLSVVATGGAPYTYAWSGLGVGSPANTSVISATQTLADGVQNYSVLVSGAGSCTAAATIGLTTNPSTFTVTNTANSGAGSLRGVLDAIAVSPCSGAFTISFATSGTISLTSSLTLSGKRIIITGNQADPGSIVLNGGGGSSNYPILALPSAVTLTVNYLTFSNGRVSSSGGGGAIQANGGNLTLNRCVLANNQGSINGGAILIQSASRIQITDCYFYNNTTTNTGGAIYHTSGSYTVTNSTFANNAANNNSGAIGSIGADPALVINCTFFGNRAGGAGGAIEASVANLTITNSTFVSNTAATGGGIYGGNGTDRITINNCLIAGNTATTNGPDLFSAFRSGVGHNLVGSLVGSPTLDPSTAGNITGVSVTTVVSQTLADNGGFTPTLALIPGSPAVNAGIGTGADQRGFAVFGSIKDIGAFESQTLQPVVATISSVSVAPCATGLGRFSLGATGGNGGYEYKLTSGGSFSPLTTNPLTITGVVPGSYTVTVQDNLGNTDDVLVTITPASLTLTTALSPNPVCSGGSISTTAIATGNPTYTYAWLGVGISSGITSRTITATPTSMNGVQTYTVVVTGGSCTATATASVTVTPSAFTVTSLADAGTGSLRQAFADISALTCSGTFTITMGVSGTISVVSTLNVPDKSIVLRGYSTDPADVVLAGGGASSNYSIMNNPSSATLTVSYLTFANSRATSTGGGAILTFGNLTVSRCVFFNNRANGTNIDGGAINQAGGLLTVSDSYFYNNSTTDAGGAIYPGSGSFTITTSTFASNTATGNGGAIQKTTSGNGFIDNCTFFGNRAVTGGGIEASVGSLTVSNSTFSQNRGTTSGGGIFGGNGSNRVTINNCLIVGNISSSGPDLISSFRSDTGYNLIGNLAGSPVLDPITTGNITGVSATTTLSATLADNGGFTPTLALLPGSRAINGGIGAGPDQRGLAVFGTAKDVGAFEYQSPVDLTWTGAVSTDWNTTGNWLPAVLPTSNNRVILNSGSPRYPVLTNNLPQAYSVQLNTGASITINAAGVLTLTGGTNAVLTQGGQLINGGRLVFQ